MNLALAEEKEERVGRSSQRLLMGFCNWRWWFENILLYQKAKVLSTKPEGSYCQKDPGVIRYTQIGQRWATATLLRTITGTVRIYYMSSNS